MGMSCDSSGSLFYWEKRKGKKEQNGGQRMYCERMTDMVTTPGKARLRKLGS